MTLDTAFGEGSDARIAGLPRHYNPHHGAMNHNRASWDRGWDDVDRHWGKSAKWPVRLLPQVKR